MPIKILEFQDGGDDFRRCFIVYVVSSCISGNPNRTANTRILKSLIDCVVKDYNWCRYTLRSLEVAIKDWKAKPLRFFTGPILFLIVSIL